MTSPSFRTVNGRRRKLAASTTIAQPPARALGYTTGCSEGPTLVRLTPAVTANSVIVTATFVSSSPLTPKADMKIIVLNNATRGLANMFAPTASFVTYPALNATPAPTNNYSVVFTLPPLEGPATYVFTPPSIHTHLAASVQHLPPRLPSRLPSRLSSHLPSSRPSTRAVHHGPSYFSSPYLHPALSARPAVHTSLHTSRPAPLRRYVLGWDSGTWVDSKGNAASALSFKQVRRRSALESSPASPLCFSQHACISMCLSHASPRAVSFLVSSHA